MTSIVDRIDARLAALNMSRQAACIKAGLGKDYIRDLERRPKTSAGVDAIAKLAAVLETSIAWLYGSTDVINEAPANGAQSAQPTTSRTSRKPENPLKQGSSLSEPTPEDMRRIREIGEKPLRQFAEILAEHLLTMERAGPRLEDGEIAMIVKFAVEYFLLDQDERDRLLPLAQALAKAEDYTVVTSDEHEQRAPDPSHTP
jgi:transcriptional regulator with XRE-family HTH domain